MKGLVTIVVNHGDQNLGSQGDKRLTRSFESIDEMTIGRLI